MCTAARSCSSLPNKALPSKYVQYIQDSLMYTAYCSCFSLPNRATPPPRQLTEFFRRKTIQLYEMICVRHGLMIVGRPFGAKTSMLRVLAGSLTEMCAKLTYL